MHDRIEDRARFDLVRYANCWEDADVLLQALEIKPTGFYLSVASAGDNTLSLLSANPAQVIAARYQQRPTGLSGASQGGLPQPGLRGSVSSSWASKRLLTGPRSIAGCRETCPRLPGLSGTSIPNLSSRESFMWASSRAISKCSVRGYCRSYTVRVTLQNS